MNVKKTITPLTDEQRQFAEERADIIWWFIHKHLLGSGDPEQQNDWYGEIAEAYLAAVRKYRAELGSFSAFAHACMWRRLQSCLVFRNRQMRTRLKAVSMSAPITGNEDCTLEGILPDADFSTEDIAIRHVYASQMIARIWPVLTEKHKTAILAKAFYEDAWREAAKALGIKPRAYRMRIRYARQRIKEKVPLELQFQQDT